MTGVFEEFEDYGLEWFQSTHSQWRLNYDLISGWLLDHLSFDDVLDLGCGCAFFIDFLKQEGKKVCGVDASASVKQAAPALVGPGLIIADLRTPLALPAADLVITTETAEHLPAQAADIFVSNVCTHARRCIAFSAAVPGQGGFQHLNEQPHSYWIEKISQHSCVYDRKLTSEFRSELLQHPLFQDAEAPRYLIDNMLFFKRSI